MVLAAKAVAVGVVVALVVVVVVAVGFEVLARGVILIGLMQCHYCDQVT